MPVSLSDLSRARASFTSPSSKLPKLSSTRTIFSADRDNRVSPPLPESSACSHSDHARSSTTEVERARTNNHHPHYIAEHLGDACSLGALDHLLHCGHKVITGHAEICASNCQQSASPFINPKSIDLPFVCMACVTSKMKVEHEEKLSSFLNDLEVVARTVGKCDAASWIAGKAGTMEEAWRDLEIARMAEEVSKGRFGYAIEVDEAYKEAYVALVGRVEALTIAEAGVYSPDSTSAGYHRVDRIRKTSRIPKKSVARCITLM